MYKNKKIDVVVPVYNEEKFIGMVIESVPDFVDKIYAINDASIDNTLGITGRKIRLLYSIQDTRKAIQKAEELIQQPGVKEQWVIKREK